MNQHTCGGSVDCAWGCPGCEEKLAAEPQVRPSDFGPDWQTITVRTSDLCIAQARETWKSWYTVLVNAETFLRATTDRNALPDTKQMLRGMADSIHDLLYVERP